MLLRASLFTLLLWPLAALSQPLIKQIQSIEARTLNSQYIGIGRITDLKTDQVGNADVLLEQAFRPGLMVGRMHLKVAGKPEQLAKWRDSKSRLLFFEEFTIDLSDPEILQVTSDGRFLRSPAEVIAAVERTIDENPGVYRIMNASKGMIKVNGEDMILMVPVDKKLERWCHETIRSSKDQDKRARAVGAMVYFPSKGNVDLLKRLLKDEGTVELSGGKHRYWVRIRAWEILSRFGVDVPKPEEFRVDRLVRDSQYSVRREAGLVDERADIGPAVAAVEFSFWA